MRERTERRRRFNKRNELMILSLAAALGFTLMLFSPVEVYTANPDSFGVEFRYIAVPMLCFAVLTTAALAGLMNLLLFISEKLCSVFSKALLGLLFAFFAQSVFMEGNMPIVIQNDTRYNEYKTSVYANAVIFFLVFISPLAVHIAVKLIKKESSKENSMGAWMTAGFAAAIFIFNMGSSGLKLLNVDLDGYKGVHRQYLSYEPVMSLSKEENIVVFLTDRLDREWLDDVIEGYPELENEFSGFTYYRNNVSEGTSTFPVVPSMLTASNYKGEEWPDYLSNAWSGETVAKKLKNSGYNVYLVPDSITTLSSVSQVNGQCDNVKEYRECELRLRIFGKRAVLPVMVKLSLARMSPYVMKHRLTYWMGANFTRNFFAADDKSDAVGPQSNVNGDIKFYQYMKNNGLNSESEAKTFTFVHLNCAHAVDSSISSIYGFSGASDVYSTIRGDLEIILEYIRSLKEMGVFDNTTIIVLGDHGRAPRELKGGQDALNSAITSALLIKPARAAEERLKIDSDSELSTAFFSASILEYAGIDHSEYGYSYNDIINGGISTERFLRSYDFAGYGRMVYKALYKIVGNARDFENWERVE